MDFVAVEIAACVLCGVAPTDQSDLRHAYLEQIAAWAQPFTLAQRARREALDALAEGAQAACELHACEDGRVGRAWAATWGGEQTGSWSRIAAVLGAAIKEPPPAPPALLACDPHLSETIKRLRGLTEAVDRLLAHDRPGAETMVRRIKAVAEGKQEPDASFGLALIKLGFATARSESELASVFRAASPAGHPVRALLSALIEGNFALIELGSTELAFYAEEPVDHAALAASLRRRIVAIERAAGEMENDARRMRAFGCEVGGGIGRVVEAAMAAYDRNAGIERAIAATLGEIAARLDAPGELDWSQISTELVATFIEQRAAVSLERQEAVAGAL